MIWVIVAVVAVMVVVMVAMIHHGGTGEAAIDDARILWRQRKANWCGTHLSFTVYTLTDEELDMESGIIRQTFDTTQLFRVNDIRITRTLLQRVFGLSTLTVYAYDASSVVDSKSGLMQIRMANVEDAQHVRHVMQQAIDGSRKSNHVIARDIMSDGDGAYY